jgi:NitT/TauT family transport system permease protein
MLRLRHRKRSTGVQSATPPIELLVAAKSAEYRSYLRTQKRKGWTIRAAQLALLVVLLLLWEVAANQRWIDPMLTSQPSRLVSTFGELAFEGTLLYHTWITTVETVIGIIVSMSLGTLIAALFWWSTYASKVLDPYIVVLNALPKIALGPIFYIWLGDRYSIYGMAIAISIIVTIMMIESGFREISRTKLRLMESLGATRLQMIRMVLIPASVPTVIATLKVNVGLTLVGVIMGEFLSSKAGLGFLITYGSQVFQMDMVMVSIMILAVLSVLLYGLVNIIGYFALRKYHYNE